MTSLQRRLVNLTEAAGTATHVAKKEFTMDTSVFSSKNDSATTAPTSHAKRTIPTAILLVALMLASMLHFAPSADAYNENYLYTTGSSSYNYTSGSGVVSIKANTQMNSRAFFCGFLWKNDCMNFKNGFWSVTSSRVSGTPRYADQAKVVASVDVDYWKVGISGASISTTGAAGLSFSANSGTVGCNTGEYYSAYNYDDVSVSTASGVEFCKIVQPATILNGVIASHFSKAKSTSSGGVRFNGTTWKAANAAVATRNY